MDTVAWGVDLASVEQHINSHRSLHNAIGDYRWQLDKIKADLVPHGWGGSSEEGPVLSWGVGLGLLLSCPGGLGDSHRAVLGTQGVSWSCPGGL